MLLRAVHYLKSKYFNLSMAKCAPICLVNEQEMSRPFNEIMSAITSQILTAKARQEQILVQKVNAARAQDRTGTK